MGAAHVGAYGAASDHAFIAAMLDLPLLDGACDRFAHGLNGRLGEIPVAFGVGARDRTTYLILQSCIALIPSRDTMTAREAVTIRLVFVCYRSN